MNCMKIFSRYQRAAKARLVQLSYMVFVMHHNISLFSISEHHSLPSSVPHAQIPERSPTIEMKITWQLRRNLKGLKMKSSSRRSSWWACTSWCPQWGAPRKWTWTCWSQYLRKNHGFCAIMIQLHLWVSIPAPPWQVLAIPQRGSGRGDWNQYFWKH